MEQDVKSRFFDIFLGAPRHESPQKPLQNNADPDYPVRPIHHEYEQKPKVPHKRIRGVGGEKWNNH